MSRQVSRGSVGEYQAVQLFFFFFFPNPESIEGSTIAYGLLFYFFVRLEQPHAFWGDFCDFDTSMFASQLFS